MSSKSILIVSNGDDAHARVVAKRMNERAVGYRRLDSDTFASGAKCWRIPAAPAAVELSSWYAQETEVVWYRKPTFPDGEDAVRSFIRQEREGMLDCILSLYADCRWINPRQALAQAKPKLAQLRVARNLGLRIPDTLVTTDIVALQEFSFRHDENIVAKPLQAQIAGTGDHARVLGTRRLRAEYYEASLKHSPCFAQECLTCKSEIRVVAFGAELYPFRLIPKERADDIKQVPLDKIRHEPCVLDTCIAQKLRDLMIHYKLAFGAIDLVDVGDEEPVFLELNANGQWLWLQYMTGVNLEDPFIDFLCA